MVVVISRMEVVLAAVSTILLFSGTEALLLLVDHQKDLAVALRKEEAEREKTRAVVVDVIVQG